jgi:ATP-dependent helicase/nuclease subunit B
MLDPLQAVTPADWIITPNHRSGLALLRRLQQKTTETHYRLPECLSEDALLLRLWTRWQQHCPSEQLRTCLTPVAERALWLDIMSQDVADAEAKQLVTSVMQAWQLQHDWLCPSSLLHNADGLAQTRYSRWQRLFQQSLQQLQCITTSELASVLAKETHLTLPKHLYRVEPLFRKPSVERLFQALTEQGTQLTLCEAEHAATLGVIDASDESQALVQAVAWARQQLATGAGSVAVVVPQLKSKHNSVKQAFEIAGLDCNVSAGHCLLDFPLVAHSLNLLNCLSQPDETNLLTVSQNVFLNPDLVTAAKLSLSQQAACAQYRPWLSASKLFADFFDVDFYTHHQSLIEKKRQSATEWIRRIEQIFTALTYPRKQLDSQSYQLWQRLLASLRQLRSLDWVRPQWTLPDLLQNWQAALRQLQFQAEGSEAPVQILGLFESLNIRFDSIFLLGLTQDVLPERSNANPFLPLAWQLQVPVGKSSDVACEARADALLQHWQQHCKHLCLQFLTTTDKRSAKEHPVLQTFLNHLDATPITLSPADKPKQLVLESLVDMLGLPYLIDPNEPILPQAAQRIEHQNQCAFKAYATHRLKLIDKASRSLALMPLQRGILQHSLLHQLLPTKDLAAAVASLESPYLPTETAWLWPLEQAILQQLGALFLLEDSKREPYEIAALEQAVTYQLDGLNMRFRLDRIDRLSDDSLVVIDYKSGLLPTKKSLLNSLDKPQLALYSLTLSQLHNTPVSAVAFFSTHPKAWGYLIVGEGSALMFADDDKKNIDNMADLNQQWLSLLRPILAAHLSGAATVAPKDDKLCNQCHLQAVCRYQLDQA